MIITLSHLLQNSGLGPRTLQQAIGQTEKGPVTCALLSLKYVCSSLTPSFSYNISHGTIVTDRQAVAAGTATERQANRVSCGFSLCHCVLQTAHAVAVRSRRSHNDLAAVLRVLESLDPEEFAQVLLCFIFCCSCIVVNLTLRCLFFFCISGARPPQDWPQNEARL